MKVFSGPKCIWDLRPKDSGSVFSGQMSQHFSLFFWKTGVVFYVPTMKKTIQIVTVKSAKTSLCDGMGVHQCPWHILHICEGTIDMEAYAGILETYAASRWQLCPESQCLFQQDNARSHSIQITTAWFRRHRVHVLNWPACSPDLSPIQNVWCIM